MVEPVFGRWGPTEVMERVLDGTWAEVVDGMGLIEPASVSFSGTSAAITGLGSVEFSACTSLSLNGVFSSDFDNYMIIHAGSSPGAGGVSLRLRAGNTDATGTNYVIQQLQASSTTVSGIRYSSQTSFVLGPYQGGGVACFLYGPNLAQPTATRTVEVSTFSGGYISDWANTHSLSTAYDGCTLLVTSGSLSGRVAVYGMVK
jgi:hypothetical protein